MGATLLHRLLAIVTIAWASLSAANAQTIAPVDAIWQRQTVTFHYRGDSVYYRCTDLIDRVTSILQVVGARGDIVVRGRCADFARTQQLELTFASPIEATEARITSAATFTTEQQLIARLHGQTLPTPADIERFAAERRLVSIPKTVRRLRLRATDCGLLRSVRDQLLPRLAARVPDSGFSCVEGMPGIAPRFLVEALVRVQG